MTVTPPEPVPPVLTVVRANAARGVGYDSFAAHTDAPVVSIGADEAGQLVVTFGESPTGAPIPVDAIAEWIAARNDVEVTLRQRAAAALAGNASDKTTNDTYLALPSPANPDVVKQVRALTVQSSRQAAQLNALIHMVLGRLESAD